VKADGYSPARHTSSFTAEVKEPRITALRFEALKHPDLPLQGPGRSPYGTFAISEFVVAATPLDGKQKAKRLKFSQVTADVNPPKRPLQSGFFDKKRKDYVTGPIELAVDGKKQTAWTIDVGPGRSNVPRQAVFVLDEPLENPAGF